MVSPVDSTVVAMRKKVRRLVGSSSEASLSTADIDRQLNAVMSQTFPAVIKQDLSRSVYTFFTQPYIDRYPLDVNYNQSVRAPVYVEGIQGSLFKDRQQFYALWPRFPTLFNPVGLTSGEITNITAANPGVVTSANHGLTTGADIFIDGITGTMSALNGVNYTITVLTANTFQLDGIDTSALVYGGGGTWYNLLWEFTIPGPFLSKEVVLGGLDYNGNPVSINDDGNGNLLYVVPNPVVSVPTNTAVYTAGMIPPYPNSVLGKPIPGMYNQNTRNPGLLTKTVIGTVDYVTGSFIIDFSLLAAGSFIYTAEQQATLWVSQYQTGRPYSLLFWNNEFTIRPVPKHIHKVEVEVYLTPVQFLETTDQPILDYWWQYVCYLSSVEILRERQDMEGIENLMEGLKFQEALVLERQANEELFTPTPTLFNSVTPSVGGAGGMGYW